MQWLLLEESLQVVAEDLEYAGVVVAWVTGSMGGDDDVRHRPKWAVGWEWLSLKHVEQGSGNGACPELLDELVFHNHRAPGDVD